MTPEWNSETAARMALYANTWVYSAIKANAEDVSSMPFRAGKTADKPDTYNSNAPLAKLLGPQPGTPNPTTTAESLFAWSVMQYRSAGRVAWEIVYDKPGGNVVALWPLPVSRLDPVPVQRAKSDTFWQGFWFDTGRGRIWLRPDQVFYHWRPSQLDWTQPESPLQAARLDISVAVMQDRYDYAFLKNNATPANIVVHDPFADPAEKHAWRARFNDHHQGVDNAGRTHFMEANPAGATPDASVSVHVLGMSQKDAQFIQRYEQKRDAILIALGTPMSRLGNASDSTFSNSGMENRHYWKSTVKAIAKDLAAAINMQVAPKVGNEVGWFDWEYIPELQPIPEFTVQEAQALVDAGLMTANELRDRAGLERITEPWADEYTKKPAPVMIAPPAPDDVPAVDDVPADDEPPALVAAGAPDYTEIRDSWFERSERATSVNAQEQASLEDTWERAFQRLLDKQLKAVLDRLEGKRGRQATRDGIPNVDGIFDREFWQRETSDVTSDLFRIVLGLAAAKVTSLAGDEFDLSSPFALAFISSRANRLSGQVTETTYRGIQDALIEGVQEGEGIPKLADRIRGLFKQTYANRAETVARTEVISSYNGATWELGQQYGSQVVAGYEWLATLDQRTRPSHAGANGQVSVGGQPFDVGGRAMRYPGDPAGGASNCISCRCSLLALTPQDLQARGMVDRQTLDDELSDVLRLVTAS